MADDPKLPTLSREPFEIGALKDHNGVLYRFAVKAVRDPALAEDLVQETFLAALAGAGNRFAGRSSVRTWLTGILKHKIADALRERAKAPVSYDEAAGAHAADPAKLAGGEEPEAVITRQRFLEACQRSLDRMSARAAQAFLLYDVLGHEANEVCAMLGMTASNLWTTLHRVRRSLRRDFEAVQAA
jgi:RNA polymerase sigma-70 factor (ECF subfamily)